MTSPWWGPSPMGGPINTPSSVGTGTRSYSPTTAKPIGTTPSGGSSEPSKPSKPSKPNGAKPPAAGSADAADRRSPGYAGPTTIEATSTGQTLWDVLDMPDLYGEGTQEYVQTIDGKQAINYTVAAGVEWLRHEAVTNPEGYNSIIARLYQAGYLSEGDVKFNTFSGKAAQAFADAAFDVARINMDKDPGAVITLDDHLQGIIDGFTESGFGPGGPGGAGAKPEPPTRVDQWSNPDDLRETLHTAAEAALGDRKSVV